MAKIALHADVPLNIVELRDEQRHLAPYYFERGWLIVLKDRRIAADFDFLSSITLPADLQKGHAKFKLTHERLVHLDGDREKSWAVFRDRIFEGDAAGFDRFHDLVSSVNDQLHEIGEIFFPGYRYKKKRASWKFERIGGQNLHIDNIDGCDHQAQLRVFANLALTPRAWSMAEHISVYADRLYMSAGLSRFVDDPFGFNHALSSAAFGNSVQSVRDPRHFIDLDPGEIWILNSAVTAHQVRSGTLLAVDCLEFPYEDYETPEDTLPSIIARTHAAHARRTAA